MNNYFENFDELLKELDLKNYVTFVKKCFKNGIKKNEETICAQDLRNLAKCLPRVSGVWYDLHKNSWEARWSEGTKSARKYYSVQKFGFHEARKLAIKTIKTKEINYLYNSINEDFSKPLKWNLNNEFLEMNHDPTVNLKKKCRAKNCKIKVKKENNNINKKMKNEKKNNQTKITRENNLLTTNFKKYENCEIKSKINVNIETKNVKHTEKRINNKIILKNVENIRNNFNNISEIIKHNKNNSSKESNIRSSNNSEETSNINHIIIKDVNDHENQNDILKYSSVHINEKKLLNKNKSDNINEKNQIQSKENICNKKKFNNVINNTIINSNKINNTVMNIDNSSTFNGNYLNEIKNDRNVVKDKNVINNTANHYYKNDKMCNAYNENNSSNDNSCNIKKSFNKENNKTNLIKFPCEKILGYILYHNKPFSKNNFYNKQIDLLKINIKQKNNPIYKENASINDGKTSNDVDITKKMNSNDKDNCINNNSICTNKLKNDSCNFCLHKNSEVNKNDEYNYYDNFKNTQFRKKMGNNSYLLNDTHYKGICNNNNDHDNNHIIFKSETFSSNQSIPCNTSKTLNNISKKNIYKEDTLKENSIYSSYNNICNKKDADICIEKKENNESCINLNLKDSVNSDTLSIFKNAINLLLKDLKYKCVPHFDKQFLNIVEIIDNHLSYVNSIFNENFLITYVHLFDICVSNNILPSQMDQKIQKVFCNALIAFHILLFNFQKEKKIN
ncbi:transcription factor with AP2 domain(s), putative [Plasmodium gallinaceum]|uniref:Transcription factor with AP2 domain(S), putative n=1 Tax=Plasmodium gallinaceum TaxID=5849 RepID=A0A1J1GTF4_PLAGA|nr:transcription factor with AP2 domain(s), putative [Plasmodium gallinaceum]CRG95796.1 transcription factor with AP2 domain(s), putative [Plasmodium gallinaceum]